MKYSLMSLMVNDELKVKKPNFYTYDDDERVWVRRRKPHN